MAGERDAKKSVVTAARSHALYRGGRAEARHQDAWVAGLRQGETAAFDAVFAAYRRRLFGYLVRMTRRRDVAEDLLQEVFLRLAQHALRLDAEQ